MSSFCKVILIICSFSSPASAKTIKKNRKLNEGYNLFNKNRIKMNIFYKSTSVLLSW